MSWSFSGTGKPAALAKKAEEDRTRGKCVEPEETIRQTAFDIIAKSLGAMPENLPVEIAANGSQSKPQHDQEKFANNFSLSIKPLWGFVE